ncbi:hypothetical protein C8J57DRAFT_1247688 [Mycena rebaudengoi]|nr:hypothetical protein C8J57DRAFT_1247688 [Mycena rebaudengoi]
MHERGPSPSGIFSYTWNLKLHLSSVSPTGRKDENISHSERRKPESRTALLLSTIVVVLEFFHTSKFNSFHCAPSTIRIKLASFSSTLRRNIVLGAEGGLRSGLMLGLRAFGLIPRMLSGASATELRMGKANALSRLETRHFSPINYMHESPSIVDPEN